MWDVLEWKWASRVLCHFVVCGISELYDLLCRRVSDSLRPVELWPRRLMCLFWTVLIILPLGLVMCGAVILSIFVRRRVAMRLF